MYILCFYIHNYLEKKNHINKLYILNHISIKTLKKLHTKRCPNIYVNESMIFKTKRIKL
jgi:hypothetical protein